MWEEGFERQSTLGKYQIALALGKAELFSAGNEPYQSAHALIALRNAIAHPKRIIANEKEQSAR